MAIEKVARCDGPSCNVVIEPNKGFVVLGNIHRNGKTVVGSIFECVGGGLVGNNLEDGGRVNKAVYYCENCMARLLGLKIVSRGCIGTP